MNLQKALKELAETILDEGFSETGLQWIVEEYEVNPVLLRRKFAEQYGVEPEGYADKMAARAAAKKVMAEADVREAARVKEQDRKMALAVIEFFATRR